MDLIYLEKKRGRTSDSKQSLFVFCECIRHLFKGGGWLLRHCWPTMMMMHTSVIHLCSREAGSSKSRNTANPCVQNWLSAKNVPSFVIGRLARRWSLLMRRCRDARYGIVYPPERRDRTVGTCVWVDVYSMVRNAMVRGEVRCRAAACFRCGRGTGRRPARPWTKKFYFG